MKAGVEERNAKWERLFERIAAEKLYIVPAGDGDRLTVQGMTEEEAAALNHPDLANRSQKRLAAMQPFQQQSVDRLRSWLIEHWFEADKVEVSANSVRPLDAPRSIQTLFEHWSEHPRLAGLMKGIPIWQGEAKELAAWVREHGSDPAKLHISKEDAELRVDDPRLRDIFSRLQNHPLVSDEIDAEWKRRKQAEADRQKQEEAERERLHWEAIDHRLASNFGDKPPPVEGYARIQLTKIRTPALYDFVKELNRAVPPARLYKQALAVQRSAAAAEEVHQHGEALARAFKLALTIKAPRVIKERGRSR